MFHCVLVHIIQTCQIRTLLLEFSVPIIEPNLPARNLIEFVYPTCSFHVQHAQHVIKARGVLSLTR